MKMYCGLWPGWAKKFAAGELSIDPQTFGLRCGSSSSPWDIKPVGEQRASRRFLTDNPNGCWGLFGKTGRSTSAIDNAPLSMVETVVMLKPQAEWREGLSWEGLIAEMDQRLRYPGMPNVWWMPIQTRTEMLATGIRSNLGIKVFGPDLAALQKAAVGIERALQDDPRTRPYTRSASAERLTGGYFLDFEIDRERIVRHGLTVDDVEDVILTAVGGLAVSETVEGRERYAISLRYARELREDPKTLARVLVPTPSGAQVPLVQLAWRVRCGGCGRSS